MNGSETTYSRKIKRNFKINHAKLVLSIDLFEELIEGYAELTIIPLKKLYETGQAKGEVKLNLRQCLVSKVEVNEIEALFEQRNCLQQIIPDTENRVTAEVFTDYYRAALYLSDDGELSVWVPDQIIARKEEKLIIRIYYELRKPKGGIHFVQPHPKAYPERFPHMYTDNEPNGARMWFPCIDNLTEHSTYEMEYTVDPDLLVVSSGDLIEQVLDENQSKKTFYYKIGMPTAAHTISLVVGTFEIFVDPNRHNVTHFCLPGRYRELTSSVSFLPKAFNFYEEFLGFPFPLKSYKQIFVEEVSDYMYSGATQTVFNTHLLHDETIIDQTYETRRILAMSLALQWFGNFISVKTWADSWIYYGIAGYLSNLFYRHIFGHNAYRLRIQKESEWVCAHDNGVPLYWNGYLHPLDIHTNEVFKRKAPLVMYMIEKRVNPEAFRKVLSNVVSPSSEGELLDRNISTKKFLKMIRRLTGADLRPFADRWIYGRGCPDFSCGFWFNRKKHVIEFALKQNKSPAGRISGSITLRAHELDGQYDHTLSFEDDLHSYEIHAHSRVKKLRKKKKGTANAQEERPEEEDPDSAKKNETPIQWVRIDPDVEYLRTISLKLPEYMWIFQLEGDIDVIAQYEAVRGLAEHVHSFKALDVLNKVLNDGQIYYPIRLEAGKAMAKNSTTGLDMLFKFFKKEFFDAQGAQIRPNDFSDLESYFMQKGVAEVISNVKDNSGRTSPEVLEFLLDLLKNNDNSRNFYNDNYYLATVLRCLTNSNTSGLADNPKIRKQLQRYLSLEKLMPSYRNTVTVACLQSLSDMQASNRIPLDLELFKQYTDYGHYEEVRITAVEALIRLGIHKDTTLEFLFNLLKNEKIPYIRSRIAELIATVPIGVDEQQYFKLFTKDTFQNVDIVKNIWVSLNSIDTCYDARFRAAMLNIFFKIWGKDQPRILRHEPIVHLFPKVPVEPGVSTKIPGLKIQIPKFGVKSEEQRPTTPKISTSLKISLNPPTPRTTTPAQPPKAVLQKPSVTALKITVPRPQNSSKAVTTTEQSQKSVKENQKQSKPANSSNAPVAAEEQTRSLKLTFPKPKPQPTTQQQEPVSLKPITTQQTIPATVPSISILEPSTPSQLPKISLRLPRQTIPASPTQTLPTSVTSEIITPTTEPTASVGAKRNFSDVDQDTKNGLLFAFNFKKQKTESVEGQQVTQAQSPPKVQTPTLDTTPIVPTERTSYSPVLGKIPKQVRIKLSSNDNREVDLVNRKL